MKKATLKLSIVQTYIKRQLEGGAFLKHIEKQGTKHGFRGHLIVEGYGYEIIPAVTILSMMNKGVLVQTEKGFKLTDKKGKGE